MVQNMTKIESKKVEFLRFLHSREKVLRNDLYKSEELATVEDIRLLFLELFRKVK